MQVTTTQPHLAQRDISRNNLFPYLANILRVRAHVLFQDKELVPYPSPFNPLKASFISSVSCCRHGSVGPTESQLALVLSWAHRVERSRKALLKQEAQEQQQTVALQHWAVRKSPFCKVQRRVGGENERARAQEDGWTIRCMNANKGEVKEWRRHQVWSKTPGVPQVLFLLLVDQSAGHEIITCDETKINKLQYWCDWKSAEECF